MIRNRTLFYVALVGAALMVLRRHAIRVEDALDMPGALMSALPDTKISLAVTIVFIGLSLFPFGGRSADKNNARRRPAGPRFVKDDLVTIAERIRDLTKGPKPDVPFIVDYLIYQGKAAGASDIHFDPSKYGFTIRFRVDGMMQDVAFVPESITNPVSNRLKVISNLVVYQGYLPQDGRLATDREGGSGEDRQKEQATADFRIAFMPTMHGERIVIRILGVADDKNFEFTSLGMSEAQEQLISRFIEEPQGMIVLTGPTGSGKTTTIYTALRAIQDKSRGQRSIATLEDPIEYEISGINQSQVDNKKDFTFDKGLRALLRQDPDVIMVGEIRDSETAKIAIQSGMTGHLIITTVHANSSSATFSRLL
jgi:type II secretory ATPase GspE/PulE/Tfp pilus assembly ATPase PilB-like protein